MWSGSLLYPQDLAAQSVSLSSHRKQRAGPQIPLTLRAEQGQETWQALGIPGPALLPQMRRSMGLGRMEGAGLQLCFVTLYKSLLFSRLLGNTGMITPTLWVSPEQKAQSLPPSISFPFFLSSHQGRDFCLFYSQGIYSQSSAQGQAHGRCLRNDCFLQLFPWGLHSQLPTGCVILGTAFPHWAPCS